MCKTTIGLMIALSLSAPLAMAQDVPVPGAEVSKDTIETEAAGVDTDASADPAKGAEKTRRSGTPTDEAQSAGKAAVRPDTTSSTVITDTLMSGEKMELTIRFKVDSDQIKGVAHKQILEIANALKGSELVGMRVGVHGHTDSDGDEDYNLDLSFRRSVTVVRTLVDMYGIEPDRLDVRGYGEGRPIANNDTDQGKALNRRVTLVRIDADESKPQ